MKTYRPEFLGPADVPWIQSILDTYSSCDGLTISEVDARLDEELAIQTKQRKFKRVNFYLKQILSQKINCKQARGARLDIFAKVFAEANPPSIEKVESLASELLIIHECIDLPAFRHLLVSDLAGQRLIKRSEIALVASNFIPEFNLWFAKSLIRSAVRVSIKIKGQARRIIQTAKLHGLICCVNQSADSCTIELSGPAAILFKTKIYGHALASVVGLLPWCDHFSLEAEIEREGNPFKLSLSSHDPIKPSSNPKKYDSGLEERFARDFLRKDLDWRLIREPGPIEVATGLIFPDFKLCHKFNPRRSVYLEIVGWWTEEYVAKKLEQWRQVKDAKFILCINKTLGPRERSSLSGQCLVFSKKINIEHLIDALNGL